jgi:hypothetical protein
VSLARRLAAAFRVRSANLPHDPIGADRRAALHREKAARVAAFRLTLGDRIRAHAEALGDDPEQALQALRRYAAA